MSNKLLTYLLTYLLCTCRRVGEQGGGACSAASEAETVWSRGWGAAQYNRSGEPSDSAGEAHQQPVSPVSRLAGVHLVQYDIHFVSTGAALNSTH